MYNTYLSIRIRILVILYGLELVGSNWYRKMFWQLFLQGLCKSFCILSTGQRLSSHKCRHLERIGIRTQFQCIISLPLSVQKIKCLFGSKWKLLLEFYYFHQKFKHLRNIFDHEWQKYWYFSDVSCIYNEHQHYGWSF